MRRLRKLNKKVIIIVAIIFLVVAVLVVRAEPPYWETKTAFGTWRDQLIIGYADGTEGPYKSSINPFEVRYEGQIVEYLKYKITATTEDVKGYDEVEIDCTSYDIMVTITETDYSETFPSAGVITEGVETTISIREHSFYFSPVMDDYDPGIYHINFIHGGEVKFCGIDNEHGYKGDYLYATLPDMRTVTVEVTGDYSIDLNMGDEITGGNSFFVSSSDGSDSNDGRSSATPWKTLEKVNDELKSTGIIQQGDDLYFKRGDTFTGGEHLFVQKGGTSKDTMIIGAYGEGERPLFTRIQNTLIVISVANTNNIWVRDLKLTHSLTPEGGIHGGSGLVANKNYRENLKISNLEISNCPWGGIFITTANGYLVEDCLIQDSGGGVCIYGHIDYDASNGVIRNCEAYRAEKWEEDGTRHSTDGFVIHRGDDTTELPSALQNAGPNHKFINCISGDNSEDGFDITAGQDIVVENCESYGNGNCAISIGWAPEGILIDNFYAHSDQAISVGWSYDVTIQNSRIENPLEVAIVVSEATPIPSLTSKGYPADSETWPHNFVFKNNEIIGGSTSHHLITLSNANGDYIIKDNLVTSDTASWDLTFVRYQSPADIGSPEIDWDSNVYWRNDFEGRWQTPSLGRFNFDKWEPYFTTEKYHNPDWAWDVIYTSTGLELEPNGENLQTAFDSVANVWNGGDIWLPAGDLQVGKDRFIEVTDGDIRVHGAPGPVHSVLVFDNGAMVNMDRTWPEFTPYCECSNMLFEDFDVTGKNGGIRLVLGDNNRYENLNAYDTAGIWGVFVFVVKGGETMTGLQVLNCHVWDTWSSAFTIAGFYPGDSTVRGPVFKDCTAKRIGIRDDGEYYNWSCGFGFVEQMHGDCAGCQNPAVYEFHLYDLYVENCHAEDCWESGFHFEWRPYKYNAYFKDCTSKNNGQKLWKHPEWFEDECYSSGFFGTTGCTFENCKAIGNGKYGFACSGGSYHGNDWGTFINSESFGNQFADCYSCRTWDCQP